MKYATSYTPLCRHRHRHDARCRRLPRCSTCGRVLTRWAFSGRCDLCERAAAKRREPVKGGAK